MIERQSEIEREKGERGRERDEREREIVREGEVFESERARGVIERDRKGERRREGEREGQRGERVGEGEVF